MHIVTYYSYKGGVGRTMALVNSAAILANKGRKVLIVDFDLEAPGISTYQPFQANKSKGLVEYVSEYISTSVAPKARDYIVSSRLGDASVWLMPAGERTKTYSDRLNAIDWESLYATREGFLFFEDLKQQWKNEGFEYVLIDSRTGHTDVGGICTRQLPDAVVLMFFPNEQNLVGLEAVVRDIREDTAGTAQPPKALFFCASNVPDLDDEDHILEKKLSDARARLNAENILVIQHYSSLTLLDQPLFVLDRPGSRLSKQYHVLVSSIMARNLGDRDGAIALLRAIQDGRLVDFGKPEAEDQLRLTLDRLLRLYAKDSEIAWHMSRIYSELGDLDNENDRLSVAITGGFNVAEALRRRAAIAQLQNRHSEAVADLKAAIQTPQSSGAEFVAIVELLRGLAPDWISFIPVNRLEALEPSEAIRVADMLMADPRGRPLAIKLAEKLASEISTNKEVKESIHARYVLILIGAKQFDAAIEVLGPRERMLRSGAIEEVFNLSMAEWGATGSAPQDLMARVIELSHKDGYLDANRYQCFALAYFVCGNILLARQYVAECRRALETEGGRVFSCWRYLDLTREQMNRDLDEMERFFDGIGSGPAVFVIDDQSDETSPQ